MSMTAQTGSSARHFQTGHGGISMMMRKNAPTQETRMDTSLPMRAMTNSAISAPSIKTAKSAMRTMTTTREPYMSIRTAIRPGTAMMSREI